MTIFPSVVSQNASFLQDRITRLQHGEKIPVPPPVSQAPQHQKSFSASASRQLNHNAVVFTPSKAPSATDEPIQIPGPVRPTTSSVQNRLLASQGFTIEEPSSTAEEEFQESDYIPTDEELGAVDLVENIANLLAEDPGNFDDFSEQIRNIFEEFYSSEYVMTISMETIFKRSTENANFRYMGAKLYNLFRWLVG